MENHKFAGRDMRAARIVENYGKEKETAKKLENDKRKKGSLVFWFLLNVLIFGLLIASFWFKTNVVPITIVGDSMYPTLKNGEDYVSLLPSEIVRGDLISFKAPDESGDYYVKRVIAVAGDTVEAHDDVVYVNGEPIVEDYLDVSKSYIPEDKIFTNDFTLKQASKVDVVPEGHYFVLGDNRTNSTDSRHFGTISEETVLSELTSFKVPSSSK